MEGKKTKGRQKIELKKIEDPAYRLVTFSKRNSGINKKCTELATLCGAEIGVMVFSETGKPFSYGHPSIETIADRLFNQQSSHPDENSDGRFAAGSSRMGAYKHAKYMQLLNKHNELKEKLRDEQLREEVHKGKERARASSSSSSGQQQGLGWWQRPIMELDFEELKQTYASFRQVHNALANHLNRVTHNVNNNVINN